MTIKSFSHFCDFHAEFFKKSSRTSILAICYGNIQNYYKIDLILAAMFTFYIENHEFFWSLTKCCPKLDKNKSTVSSFLVFVVYKSAVGIVKKQLCRMFQFLPVNVCILGWRISASFQYNCAKKW